MSYKIGIILSMIFVALFFAFGIDLISIQFVFSNLDAQSVAITYRISQYGTIDEHLIQEIESRYSLEFECLSYCHPQLGDILDYKISRQITPIVISKEPMTIAIKRSAVIGYYS
ncbi:MAG TPA: hypothetical protein PKO28_04110 [Bacilli bacterium]|nr:hypothetical protein [Bacilli bacterium]